MNTSHDVTGPINLGNPVEITMLELASRVLELVGGDSELIYEPLPADDPVQRQPVIDQAAAVLDWQPVTSLGDGLARTVEYFRSGTDISPDLVYDLSLDQRAARHHRGPAQLTPPGGSPQGPAAVRAVGSLTGTRRPHPVPATPGP